MIHGGGADKPAGSHAHDIDYSEEEKRLIEEQSQRLETWKKSPSGVVRTLKDLQGSTQSGECPSQFGEYPPQSGECSVTNLCAQPTSEKLQTMFPAQQQQQQPLTATEEDSYLKRLNKEELEMLQSLMKKMDLGQQQQPTADNVATGGTSSDETVSGNTTSSLPQSDTEGTPSTSSEPAVQAAPSTQSAPELYPGDKSAESSATPPNEVQATTSDEVDKQETIEENNTDKQKEDLLMDQQTSLDGDGLMYPGMMPATNPMATLAAMGHFLPPPAAGFMLPPPMVNPYLIPPQMYFQMVQQQQHMLMQQSMAAAAVATSPTPNHLQEEDYPQKNSEELVSLVPQDAHQAEVNTNAVEVVSSSDPPNEEQLRGHSPPLPAEVHTNFAPIQNSFSTTPQLDSYSETSAISTLKQQDLIPPSHANSVSPPHSTLLSNEDAINHSLLPSTMGQPASSSSLKQPTPEALPVQQQHRKVHNSSSEHFTIINKLTTNDSPRAISPNFAKQHKESSLTTTPSGRTNNSITHMWKQQHTSKYDRHNYTTKTPYFSQYDGDTIDHELSQMGMNNNFPNGIPTMMFSSERRKPQT